MPTKRNNIKDFAIGTNIEYNGKLYEVIEQKFCNGCSIGHICPTNDVVKHTDYSNLLSRDERIKIFGECSSICRKDHKSVVFKEVPEDNTKDKYYKIIPLWRDDNPSKLKSVEFDLPNGYVIDKDNSDLDKGIIRFKRKWLTLEELYKLSKDNVYFTNRDAIKDFCNNKIVALANFMDIARYFNGDWSYKVNSGECGYSIAYYKFVEEPHYSVCKIDNSVYTYYGNPVFKNEADAQYIIDNPNFRNILDIIFKV